MFKVEQLFSGSRIKTAGRCAPAPRLTFWKPAKSKQKPTFLLRRASLSRGLCGWRPSAVFDRRRFVATPLGRTGQQPCALPVETFFLHSGCWCFKSKTFFPSGLAGVEWTFSGAVTEKLSERSEFFSVPGGHSGQACKVANLRSEGEDQNRWALRPCTPHYFLEAVKK